jgi:hypothetical protein
MGPAFATVIPRKPTTSRPAIVRRRSTVGLAGGAELGAVGAEDGIDDDVGSPLGVGRVVGPGVASLDDGRHAVTRAATAARAAPRK